MLTWLLWVALTCVSLQCLHFSISVERLLCSCLCSWFSRFLLAHGVVHVKLFGLLCLLVKSLVVLIFLSLYVSSSLSHADFRIFLNFIFLISWLVCRGEILYWLCLFGVLLPPVSGSLVSVNLVILFHSIFLQLHEFSGFLNASHTLETAFLILVPLHMSRYYFVLPSWNLLFFMVLSVNNNVCCGFLFDWHLLYFSYFCLFFNVSIFLLFFLHILNFSFNLLLCSLGRLSC